MAHVAPKSLSLNIEGKTVEVHHDTAQAAELNKALNNDAHFQAFAADPKSFAAKYNLKIDPHVSDQLKTKLAGVNSLSALTKPGGGGYPATVWAVAVGAYSITSTKIAVAF